MKRRTIIKQLTAALPAAIFSKHLNAAALLATNTSIENIIEGPFKPSWDSLQQYKTPDWFRDAKFGMWAHWGPQCQPEAGDWYARNMYEEGSRQYKIHLKKYGHPSVFGFKDVINEWKAESWNPEELVALYKQAGARYFMAMANHHDNLDLFNSRYQSWNSLKVGPKKDIIESWEKAARNQGLPFGVSVHASHAWTWYETAQRWDKSGTYKGVPYDGKTSKKSGKGEWWDGFDPQELYVQSHPLSQNSWDNGMIHKQWNWGNGASIPTEAYCEKFFNRNIDLIDKYEPDLIYFDDTALPLWPISDVGLKIAAYHYNKSVKKHGSLQAVICGKILNEQQQKCMIWDIERGKTNSIEPLPWQTDTCIGNWHYDRALYKRHGYKTAKTVIQMLVDIVSKNGNLMLNIPVRGNGTIDEDERKVVEDIGSWMNVNSESIYSTRPWKIYGEGPALESSAPLRAQGFNEGTEEPFSSEDIRFAQKEDNLYATTMAVPEKEILVKSLTDKQVTGVRLLGYNDTLNWENTNKGLMIHLPDKMPTDIASVFEIKGIV